jgi:hypothetical protein
LCQTQSDLHSRSGQGTLVRDDAPDGSAVRVESMVRTQKDAIALELAAGGGFLARFGLVGK